MVGVPQSLAYAELAGMPPIAGLYAGALPPMVAAIFASSPYLQTGPVAITALLTYATLSTMATPGSRDYVGLGLALALVIGAVRLLLGVLRAGWLAYLMSEPMLLGFVPAGRDTQHRGLRAGVLPGSGGRRHPGRLPAVHARRTTVGPAPRAATAGRRDRAHRVHRGRIHRAPLRLPGAATLERADRELVSQGVANLAAAAVGGMPCGGSFSRSSVNRMSGTRTRWSGAFAGLAVLAFLPFAAVLRPLPLAVLGTIVIIAVVGLLRFHPLFRLGRRSLPQAVIAWSTFFATVLLAPRLDVAVLTGIGLSVAVFLWRSLQLDVDVDAEDDLLTFTPRGVLWFGTAQRLDRALLDALDAHPAARRLVIDLTRLGRIDTTGALVLRSVLDQARDAGLAARIRGVPPQSRRLTERILGPPTSPLE
ncbi:hypothetical protein BAY60_10285 [Prauserella muralis]|uniref:STAS domain-containing protein n=2 Tax=Prauserella muralis TaxID=588067 RepID=A0A2V4B0I4_9PSEU|nr:hypothetical protein BAY60_10285 [Prauserella muralis]